MKNDVKEKFKKLVNYFGGQPETCKALGVKQSTVSGWVNGKHGCRAEIALLAEKRTNGKFKAVELCPALEKLEAA